MDSSEAAKALSVFAHQPHPVTCLQCGKEFEARSHARYCSNACRQRAKYRRKQQGAIAG